MGSDHDEVWKELIIEHSQFPRGQEELDQANRDARGENPFCGDRAHVQLQVDEHGVIVKASCLARGCAISIASSSMLAHSVLGLTLEQAERLAESVRRGLTEELLAGEALPGDLDALRLVRRYPSRVKCASLSWHTLRQALSGTGETITTE